MNSLGFALTEVSIAYPEDTAIDILNIRQHPSFSLEPPNSNMISLKECEEVTLCIADASIGPLSQSAK